MLGGKWQHSWPIYELALSLFSSSIATNKTSFNLYVTTIQPYLREYNDRKMQKL